MVGWRVQTSSWRVPERALIAVMALGLLAGALPRAAADADGVVPAWQTVESPNAGSATGRLSSVACPSPTDCWAVGNGWPGFVSSATVAHWTGGAWTLVDVPNTAGTLSYMYGIACSSASECLAVGSVSNPKDLFSGTAASYMHSVVYQWDGASWRLHEMAFGDARAGSGEFSLLRAVGCIGPADCWAVGSVRESGHLHNLFLHWDGSAWTRDAVGGALDDGPLVLGSISCVASGSCMAVGPLHDAYVVPDARSTAAARWDGSSWSLAPAPAVHPLESSDPSGAVDYETWLSGVSCLAADDCWAVGDADLTEGSVTGAATSLPLVQHWDGTAWTSTVLPQAPLAVPAAPGGIESHLAAVSCITGTDCWAAGHSNNAATVPGAVDQDFVLHWDGTAWLPAPAPPEATTTFGGTLAGLACPSPSLCWAVGQLTPGEQVHELLQQWDGTMWSSVPAPPATGQVGDYIDDATCLAPDDCWAVGMDFYGQLGRTLTQHWDGQAWTIVPSADSAEDRYDSLRSVSCASTSDCWAVGSSSTWDNQDQQALALHWDGTTWALANPVPLPIDQATTRVDGAQPLAYVIQDASLSGVHCVASDDCWAVGAMDAAAGQDGSWIVGAALDAKSLFLHWNGQAWSPVPSPATQVGPLTEYDLADVTCVSSVDCTAVGSKFARLEYNFIAGRDAQTLVDRWDGTAWTEEASPNEGPNINQLSSVACAARTCWAVGFAYLDYAYSGTPRIVPLALQRGADGTWRQAQLPAARGSLAGVDCVSATDCWAVGTRFTSWYDPQATLADHWNGVAWSSADPPNAPNAPGLPSDDGLAGVACTPGADCWAVGQAAVGQERQTFILRTAAAACTGKAAAWCPPAAGALLPDGCVPWGGTTTAQDRDHDGVDSVYGTHADQVHVGRDGSVTWTAKGSCWMAGDPNDDGSRRLPVTLAPLLPATACVAWDGNVVQADRDHDGIPALSGRGADRFTVGPDGSTTWRTQSWCWIGGDLDDDGAGHGPAWLVPAVSGHACVPWDGQTVSEDRDGDGFPAVYAPHGETLVVGTDGSTHWGGVVGSCWISGDTDDDGQVRGLTDL